MDLIPRIGMIICITLSTISLNCATRIVRYTIFEKDVAISEDIVGDGTAARSRLHCMTMCTSHALCVTYSYLNNKCTLSSKQIDGKLSFTKYLSPGERLYSCKYQHSISQVSF